MAKTAALLLAALFAMMPIVLFAADDTATATTIVSETVQGTVFRTDTYVSVDQYAIEIKAATALVEFDILSMETKDNITFTDVNADCDSAFIDSIIYLFRQKNNGDYVLVAFNDDEGDDGSKFYGSGRRDGSLNTQDSYMVRRLPQGIYKLAVGRFPLSAADALAGKSTDSVNEFSPYACQLQLASYGNYQLTVRAQSTATTGIITKYAGSYIGNSCTSTASRECTYSMPGTDGSAILSQCSYDKTVA